MYVDMRQPLQVNRISLTEAAEQFGVNRRTLERWIRGGRLFATPSAGDKRQRLVDPEDVAILVEQIRWRSSRRPFSETRNDANPANDGPEVGAEPALEVEYPQMLDDTLQLLFSHYHRIINQLHPESFRELTLNQLREGPLGRDLRRLAQFAHGEVHEHGAHVLATVDSVLMALFGSAAAADYLVPRLFWDTELGECSASQSSAHTNPHELITIGAAAEMLGVTRPTFTAGWTTGPSTYVRDDINGRTWVVRRDIDNLKRVATELVGSTGASERDLAS